MPTTVESFADQLNVTCDSLLSSLRIAGIAKGSKFDSLSHDERTLLMHHFRKAHASQALTDKPRKSEPAIPKDLTTCPECGCMLRPGKLARHLKKHEARVRLAKRSPSLIGKQLAIVPPAMSARNSHPLEGIAKGIGEANRRNSKSKPQDSLPGDLIASGAAKAMKYKVGRVEICSSCKRRVGMLPMADGTVRAFDMDEKGYALGTHACDAFDKGESVRAYQGGAIDSNKRRH